MSIFGAYLEDYHFIKVIIPSDINFKKIKLVGYEEVSLNIFKEEVFSNERHLYTSFEGYICLHQDYFVEVIGKDDVAIKYHLNLGKITRTKRFDLENYSLTPVGVIYRKEQTTFRVWSPVAKEVILKLGDEEIFLNYTTRGVWEKIVKGDQHLKEYYYLVRVDETFAKTLDPHGIAATPNFSSNIVVDTKKVLSNDDNFIGKTDPIIMETSIRDLTSLKNGGTFFDAVNSVNSPFGLGYIKTLGVTYLQLMPIFGFGGVDEVKKDNYNWGYNPVCYNSISNYLTKYYNDPYGGINELKALVKTIHKEKMGVIMDVVFNHVFDYQTFPFNILVPGYAFHTDKRGFMTNSSGCGNDLNTTKLMVRKFIIDSLLYYQTAFKIDGFRFDLMNLLDVETLNLANNLLKEHNENTLVYGEGWNIPMELPREQGGLAENFWELNNYAFFNDSFRNLNKSNFNSTEGGFVLGKKFNKETLYTSFTGFCLKEEKWNSPKFSINYLECHDNLTFNDTLKKIIPNITKEEVIDRTILALGTILFSQGIPFFHLGMEFARNKKGCDNSYNASDEINGVRWEQVKEYQEIVDTFTEMIKLRKKYHFFNFPNVFDIKRYTSFNPEADSFEIRYYDHLVNNDFVMVVKNNYEKETKYFAPGTKLLFNGRRMVEESFETITINKPGIYLFKK